MGFLSRFQKPSADDPPPTESWALFAFGKLPVYKDFISAGLTDDASREFRDWMSNGFSRLWSSRDDCKTTEIPLHAFLLRLPESRKLAAGVLWGSTDQGGLRKFPFALFTILPAGKAPASVLTALDYLPAFESRGRELRRKYAAGGSLADVYQEVRGAKIQVPVRPHGQIRLRLAAALARSRVGPLATSLFGDDGETQWKALLFGLDAAARTGGAGAAAFRIPLGDGPSPLDQLKLWALRLSKGSPSGPGPNGVLYRTEGAVPCGIFFFRDARAEDILLFHQAAIPTDFVEEIPSLAVRPPPAAREGGPAAGAGPARADAPAAEARPVEGVLRLGAAAGPSTPPDDALETATVPAMALQPEPAPVGEPKHGGPSAPVVDAAPSPAAAPVAEAAPDAEAASAVDPAAVTAAVPFLETAPITEAAPIAEPGSVTEPVPFIEPTAVPAPSGWDVPLASLLEGS